MSSDEDINNDDYGNDTDFESESDNYLGPKINSNELDDYAAVQNIQPLVNVQSAVSVGCQNRRHTGRIVSMLDGMISDILPVTTF